MTQVISLNTKTADEILTTLNGLKKEVARLRKKLEEGFYYGSRQWWQESEKLADKDIKAGRVMRFTSVKKATEWLNS